MIIQISIIAGEIWHYLEKDGQVTVTHLAANINKSRDKIMMALGWLVREGYVILEKKGLDYKCILVEQPE